MDLGVKEPDDICYYLETFYVVSVEFVATLNSVETTLFKNSFSIILVPGTDSSVNSQSNLNQLRVIW